MLAQLDKRPGGHAPRHVDGGAARDREDERGERAAFDIEARRRAPQSNERLLDELLCEPAVAEQAQADSVQAPAVAVVELEHRSVASSGVRMCDTNHQAGLV